MNIRFLMVVIFYFSGCFFAQAQRTATTEEGEAVILSPDGTWRSVDDRAGEPGVEERSGCDFKVLERDQFTEERWLVLQGDTLVAHTPSEFEEETRSNESFIHGMSYCAFVGGQYGIFFNWHLNTDSPDAVFGGLSSGNELKIFLEGAEPVTAEWVRNSEGRIDFENDAASYANNALIDEAQKEALMNHPVKKIGVQWDGEYAEYPAVDPEMFMRQLSCIEKEL